MFGHNVLRRKQRLDGDVFPFFADAGNLEALTPPWLRFHIVTPQPVEMRVGTLIEYRLTLRGLPVSWLTRIDEWEPGVRFVDSQLAGPYKLWHHTHEFEPGGDGGTVMRDTVRWALPAAGLPLQALVRRELERIFDYRAAQLTVSVPSMPRARWSPTGQ